MILIVSKSEYASCSAGWRRSESCVDIVLVFGFSTGCRRHWIKRRLWCSAWTTTGCWTNCFPKLGIGIACTPHIHTPQMISITPPSPTNMKCVQRIRCAGDIVARYKSGALCRQMTVIWRLNCALIWSYSPVAHDDKYTANDLGAN